VRFLLFFDAFLHTLIFGLKIGVEKSSNILLILCISCAYEDRRQETENRRKRFDTD